MYDRREPTHSDKPDITRPIINICKFYARGKCKHGLAGKGCNKPNPRPCRKLLRHGPLKSKQNADGCEGWSKCDKWHPKHCRTSVRKNECTYEKCKYVHIMGTKRLFDGNAKTSQHKKSNQDIAQPTRQNDHTDHF